MTNLYGTKHNNMKCTMLNAQCSTKYHGISLVIKCSTLSVTGTTNENCINQNRKLEITEQ